MPTLPTLPATSFANVPGPLPITFASIPKGGAVAKSSYLLPADNTIVVDLAGAHIDQAVAASVQRAIFVVEAASGTTASVIARFWETGDYPTAGSGLPIYDGQPVEIRGQGNIINCRMISADGGAHTINVQYYTTLE